MNGISLKVVYYFIITIAVVASVTRLQSRSGVIASINIPFIQLTLYVEVKLKWLKPW